MYNLYVPIMSTLQNITCTCRKQESTRLGCLVSGKTLLSYHGYEIN